MQVLVNDDEQYSLWPAHRAPPAGWREIGKTGNRKECLDPITKVWTDMRPRNIC